MKITLYQHFNLGGKHLATIYFKESLVCTALNLIKLKGTDDKLKARSDIDQIDTIVNNYFNGYGYDPATAVQLDNQILQEYPIIRRFNSLSPTTVSRVPKANPTPAIDPVISNLIQDRYGIMFDVLFKEGYVHELEDFVERVE